MQRNCIVVLILLLTLPVIGLSQAKEPIIITTRDMALVLKVADDHLCQAYLGPALKQQQDYLNLPVDGADQAYSTSGMTNRFNAALRVTHTDGNPSLDLQYVDHRSEKAADGVRLTEIKLKDPKYPFQVTLFYKAFYEENVIKTWSVIRHEEKAPVMLHEYASANLYLNADDYWLTHFHGDWAKEMQMQTDKLTSGIKVIDSKLGTRATKYQNPGFMLSAGQPSTENSGEVLAGTLAWSGNFRLSFEIDNTGELHVISGINPFASDYPLEPETDFKTPAFIFTYSTRGKGQATRNIDRWARRYSILDGTGPRLTLLNNWEATYFKFNEDKLVHLFDQAKEIGVDMFLLDDGWFGNKYPRNNARAGLGDWQVNKQKLPHGIGYLVKQANERGLKFGIWIEPEMVNPKSELYEKHQDWIIKLPNRPENYHRNQLVLDLTNPEVQDFVYGIVDQLMTKHPGIAYFKWDCNRIFSNEYSPYLGKAQSRIYVDYVRGLYNVLQRVRKKYPDLPMMLCSGGGGRVDYGALKYFTEFWPSDNTNPMDRIMIQWGYSFLYPAIATCAHVTESGDYSLKFKIDVAMMGKLGFDMEFDKLSNAEISFIRQALRTYDQIKDVVWYGDIYRLLSPYEGNRAALMYASKDKNRAVVFTYSMHDVLNPVTLPVRLNGLDPDSDYRVEEVNLPEGKKSRCPESGNVYSGSYLMHVGIHAPVGGEAESAVFALTAQ